MPKRQRVLKGSTVLLLAVVTGCASPTNSPSPVGADAAAKVSGGSLVSNNAGGLISNNAGGLISNNAGGLISNNAGGLISNNAGGLISNNAGGLISNNAGGLISNNAGGLISNNAGGLTGTVRGPAAGLISNNAGGLISNNAGGLISNNAGGLISNNAGGLISNNAGGLISNNAGGLISNNAGGYRTLQQLEDGEELVDFTQAVGGARCAVFNERGEMISYGWSTTDEDGNYLFTRLKASGPLLFVKCIYELEGQQIVLVSTAPAPRAAGLVNVAVTPSTTIIAKKFGEMIRLRAVNAATLRPSAASKLATALAPTMTERSIVAAAIFTNDLAADTFDNLIVEAKEESPTFFDIFVQVATGSNAAAAIAETPAQELPPLAANDAPPPAGDPAPNVDSGTGDEPVAADPGTDAPPVADPGTPGAPPATNPGTGNPGTGNPPAANEPPPSALKSTIATLGQARSGKRLEVEPNTGNIFMPSEGGVETASAGGLTGELSFADAGATAKAVAFDGAKRYDLDGGSIKWNGGSVVLQGFDPSWATDLAVKGNSAYISSKAQNCVYKVDLTSGDISPFAGAPSYYGGMAEGQGAAAAFNQPTGIACGADALYVADTFNRRVRKITYDGTVSTLAGGRFGSADGSGGNASFTTPTDVALDSTGNIFVVDQAGQTIRKCTVEGNVSTIAGNKALGNVDGTGDKASFYFPTSLAFGKVGGVEVIFVGQNDGKVRVVSGF